jgi:myo-inositol-1(or 4)-monophosphatase
MTDQSPDELLAVALEGARAAAAFIRGRAPGSREIVWTEKSATDFVSEVDLGAEALILDVVRRRVPAAGVLAEESAATMTPERLGQGVVFVVDPLDGTTNFLHGFPEYAVSIGVLSRGSVAAAVVINVPLNEEFTATAGGGTRCNGELVYVSTISSPLRALIGTGFPFKNPSDIPPYQEQMSRVMAQVSGVRRPGAAALDLASVASGRFDAFWEPMLAPWDIAAGMLLVHEAGGIVTDVSGAPATVSHTGVVAGNPAMHAWLLKTITAA